MGGMSFLDYGSFSIAKMKGRGNMGDLVKVTEIFGEDVFNDAVMQERLPKKVYKELKKTIEEGTELTSEIADVVAHEMKEWAIEKGATHFSHWFQPLTGVTESADVFFRKRADQRRTGCFLLPFRRPARHI